MKPFDGIFAGFENSTDVDTLGATVTDIDAVTIDVDDPSYSGGAPRLYAVQNGEIGNFTGANMIATFVTGNVEPYPQDPLHTENDRGQDAPVRFQSHNLQYQ